MDINQSGDREPNAEEDQSHVNMKQLGPLLSQNNHANPFSEVNNDDDGSDDIDIEESVK